jgi:hypothetical protein
VHRTLPTAIPEDRRHTHDLAYAKQDIQKQIDPAREPAADFMYPGGAERGTREAGETKLRHHRKPEHGTEDCMKIRAGGKVRSGPQIPQ